MTEKDKNLKEEHEALKKIHYTALHELAGAAQMIKSYEYLLDEYEAENRALREIVEIAAELSQVPDYDSFLATRTKLLKALARFRSRKKKRDRQHPDNGVENVNNHLLRIEDIFTT